MIDNKEFKKRIKKIPFGKEISYDELAYDSTVSDRVYSFCPLCKKIVVVTKDQVESRTQERYTLSDTVSCDCRSGIRYLNKEYLQKREEPSLIVWRSIGICAAVFIAAMIALKVILAIPDDNIMGWCEPLAIFLLVLAVAALVGGVMSFFYPVELLFRERSFEDPRVYYQDVLGEIYKISSLYLIEQQAEREAAKKTDDNSLIHGFNDDAPVKQEPEEEPYIEDKSKIHGFNDGAPVSSAGLAAAAGYESEYQPLDDEPNYDPDSYVPDDFEPGLDPYDRQALYDEEVIDDWIIAGGGDPFDFNDRMDALSDPFGFGGDGDPWD